MRMVLAVGVARVKQSAPSRRAAASLSLSLCLTALSTSVTWLTQACPRDVVQPPVVVTAALKRK